MRHLMLLVAIVGVISLAGCSDKPEEKTQTKTTNTATASFDYFSDAEFESAKKSEPIMVVNFTADW